MTRNSVPQHLSKRTRNTCTQKLAYIDVPRHTMAKKYE